MGFGSQIHEFAEDHARGRGVEPTNPDEEHVRNFLDTLDGELRIEERVYLPLEIDGERLTLTGVADLICVECDRVRIVDYKTDLSDHAESEYRKQLSVYYQVVSDVYPDREVTAELFYTSEGASVEVDPLSIEALRDVVKRSRADSASA